MLNGEVSDYLCEMFENFTEIRLNENGIITEIRTQYYVIAETFKMWLDREDIEYSCGVIESTSVKGDVYYPNRQTVITVKEN